MDFQVTPLEPGLPGMPADNAGFRSSPSGLNKTPFWKMKKFRYGIIGVVLLAVIIFLITGNPFSQSNVDLKLEGPQEIAAGELATYKVHYENKNKSALVNAKLIFFYPDDAVVIKDDRVALSNNTSVDLGKIDYRQGGDVEFRAYLVGDRGNVKNAKVKLVFSTNRISSTLEKTQDLSTTITSLSVPLALVAPPIAEHGQSINYILDYRNQSSEDKTDLRVKLVYPSGFRFTQSIPQPNVGNDTWDIASLIGGSGGRIS